MDETQVLTLLDLLAEHPYLYLFGALFLCGTLVPFPEELLLVSGGYLVGAVPGVEIQTMIAICFLGVLCGDTTIFFLGRSVGEKLLKARFTRVLFHPRRLIQARKFIDRHGNKAIILGRPLAGIRILIFFSAGSLRMPVWRFVLFDLIGAMITVPLSVLLGWYFFEEIGAVFTYVHQANRVLVVTVVAIFAILGLLYWKRMRSNGGSNSNTPMDGTPFDDGAPNNDASGPVGSPETLTDVAENGR